MFGVNCGCKPTDEGGFCQEEIIFETGTDASCDWVAKVSKCRRFNSKRGDGFQAFRRAVGSHGVGAVADCWHGENWVGGASLRGVEFMAGWGGIWIEGWVCWGVGFAGVVAGTGWWITGSRVKKGRELE